MKKALILFVLIFIGFKSQSYAAWGDESLINRSSYVVTNETLASISSTTIPGGVFVGVVVSSSLVSGMVTFYDTNGVKTSTIGVVSLQGTGNGAFYIPFEVRISSGLTYTSTGNAAPGFTIIYKITRPN